MTVCSVTGTTSTVSSDVSMTTGPSYPCEPSAVSTFSNSTFVGSWVFTSVGYDTALTSSISATQTTQATAFSGRCARTIKHHNPFWHTGLYNIEFISIINYICVITSTRYNSQHRTIHDSTTGGNFCERIARGRSGSQPHLLQRRQLN